MEKKVCVFDGKEHLDGSEICDFQGCMVCRDGEWIVNWIPPFGQ